MRPSFAPEPPCSSSQNCPCCERLDRPGRFHLRAGSRCPAPSKRSLRRSLWLGLLGSKPRIGAAGSRTRSPCTLHSSSTRPCTRRGCRRFRECCSSWGSCHWRLPLCRCVQDRHPSVGKSWLQVARSVGSGSCSGLSWRGCHPAASKLRSAHERTPGRCREAPAGRPLCRAPGTRSQKRRLGSGSRCCRSRVRPGRRGPDRPLPRSRRHRCRRSWRCSPGSPRLWWSLPCWRCWTW
mmetsp:Transcript_50687/g.121034  ORF Transcript_50687/g.121034 Transcript_50687/m.121034 type:complete len:236 (+) Transcript_50687:484-1191(+)